MHTNLLQVLDQHVAERGEKVFTRHLIAGGVEELTFASFQQRSAQFARFFQAVGCSAGDVVLIFLPTSSDELASFVGGMMAGAVPSLMPLPSAKQHPAIYWDSHRTLLDRINPAIVLTDRGNAAQMMANGLHLGSRRLVAIEDVPSAIVTVPHSPAGGDDVALLQHSSGTTSLKKGVMLSHGAILRQVQAYAASLGATGDDGIASWLPLYHDMGLIACSMMPLVLGQTVSILDPFAWVARPAGLLDVAQRYDCRYVWMPNFAFEHMARAVPDSWTGDLSGVRAFINCSEPCKPETFDRFLERFGPFGLRRDALQVCYAMAETVFAVSQTRLGSIPRVLKLDRTALRDGRIAAVSSAADQETRVLSNGPILAGLTVTIRHPEERSTLNERTVGEIAVEGAFLFDGYLNAPEITAGRLEGRCYFTRDLGFIADGELYVLGRKDDLIIINGRNLHAHEVEGLAGDVPGIKPGRAVAFGVFSEASASEELVIVAERTGGDVDAAHVSRVLRERVLNQTNIDVKDVQVVDADWLVKTTSGKISREKNHDKYLEMRDVRATAPATTEQKDDVFAAIAQVIARLFRFPLDKVSRRTVASDVSGWDSLAHATMILEIEKALEIGFADDELFSFSDVGALVDRASQLQGSGAADRMLLDDQDVSIVKMGEPGNGPDLIIFNGAAKMFAGSTMMDFASTLDGTSAQSLRKFFVTDKRKRWFTEAGDRIASTINAASSGRKIVIGVSMGGYGALSIGPRLNHVNCILAFVPQPSPPPRKAERIGRTGEEWLVRPAPGIPTCIIFGEVGDDRGKAWIYPTFVTEESNPILTLPNCGHNVVPYLNELKLLADVLLTTTNPANMVQRAGELLLAVQPSSLTLRDYVLALSEEDKAEALPHLVRRLAEEGLPPLTIREQEPCDRAKRRRRMRRYRAAAAEMAAHAGRAGDAKKGEKVGPPDRSGGKGRGKGAGRGKGEGKRHREPT